MSKPETIRNANLGKTALRLVRKDGRFFGLANGAIVVEGDDADDVWRRLHDDAGKGDAKYFGFDEAALAAFRATNMLFSIEQARVQAVLRGATADDFVRAAARFALGGGAPALADMEKALKPHDAAKWTIATYLPFFWRPDAHMYLKPQVTQDFAARVGHPFAARYQASMRMGVYDSLLDLVPKTDTELAPLTVETVSKRTYLWKNVIVEAMPLHLNFHDEPFSILTVDYC